MPKTSINTIMIRKLLLFAALSVAASAMADQKQTVVIQGGKVDNSVRKIAFQGDKAVLTFADGNTQTVRVHKQHQHNGYQEHNSGQEYYRTMPYHRRHQGGQACTQGRIH